MSPDLSIVTTLYKSAATIEDFVRRATAAAEKITSSFEIVIVDDGSPDDSLAIAVGLQARDSRLRVVELSRNFGHHRALMAGLMHARGEMCFLIDSDLEEAPELLLEFWDKRSALGVDVLYGYQSARGGTFSKRVSGDLAYAIFRALIPYTIPKNHITVRLMTRAYVNALILHQERNTAIGGLWVITGFKQIGHAVEKGSREGTTYSFFKRWHVLIDSVASFSEVPLLGIFYLGMAVSLAAVSAAIGLFIAHLSGLNFLVGWASVMVSIWLVGGVLIFCVGVIGIYISKIFIETKNRPYIIVRALYDNSISQTAHRELNK